MAAVALWVVAVLLYSHAAAAEKAFTGEDAAYADWAWKNCGMAATAKEGALVDRAGSALGNAFQRSYEQQYQKLIDTVPAGAETKRQCETVVGWYGPVGSRIADLIASKDGKPAAPGVSVGSPASSKSQGSGSGKRGGGRRGGS